MDADKRVAVYISYTLVIISMFFINSCMSESIDEIINRAAKRNMSAIMLMQDDGSMIVEYDIHVSREDYDQWQRDRELDGIKAKESDSHRRKKRKAIRNRRWTNNIVPYTVAGHMTSSNRAQIRLAINEWNHYTCLRFQPHRGERNKVHLQNGGGCSSYVGMQGGYQIVSLAPGCRVKGVIVHELGHAIGFHHEQTRPDRDNYVTIIRQNIPGHLYYNFQKYSSRTINTYGVPYDYRSIMHYGKTAFGNGRVTIQTKDPRFANVIGNRRGLSFQDIRLANLMYNCGGRCGEKNCPKGSYVDKNCECMCEGNPVKKCDGTGGGGGTGTGGGGTGTGGGGTGTGGGGTGTGGGSNTCRDFNSNCRYWSRTGWCARNPMYMNINCKKSCNKCGTTTTTTSSNCRDYNRSCAYWSRRGECGRNPNYMHVYCKKSCNRCRSSSEACRDKNTQCQAWRRLGYCRTSSRYRPYMLGNCKATCRLC